MKKLLALLTIGFISVLGTSFAFETVMKIPVNGEHVLFSRYLTTKASGLFYAKDNITKTKEGFYNVLSMVEYNNVNKQGVKRVVVEQYLADEYYLVSRMIGYGADNSIVYDKNVESLKWNYISPQDISSLLLYLAKEKFGEN